MTFPGDTRESSVARSQTEPGREINLFLIPNQPGSKLSCTGGLETFNQGQIPCQEPAIKVNEVKFAMPCCGGAGGSRKSTRTLRARRWPPPSPANCPERYLCTGSDVGSDETLCANHAMVALHLGCGPRRSELLSVTVKTIQQRQAPLSGSLAKRISEKKLYFHHFLLLCTFTRVAAGAFLFNFNLI
jgi:hypothetical protein